MDRIPVKTEQGVFEAEKGEDLLRFLHRIGISVPSDCGGAGTCGKCAVDIVQGGTVFRVKACSYRIEEEIGVLAAGKGEGRIRTANRTWDLPAGRDLAAVDLGTTAVSAVLCRGGRICERTERNCLSVYGSDVISRAGAIRERGELGRAAEMLRDQLYGMISRLCGEAGCLLPEKVTVGGNTVMEHILAGRDPFPITVYPFEVLTGKSFDTGIIYRTEHSYAVHHHFGSWVPDPAHRSVQERYEKIRRFLEEEGVTLF